MPKLKKKKRTRMPELVPYESNDSPDQPFGVAYPFPRPSVTVDCVVFGFDTANENDSLQVLLIRRGDAPYKNYWALPGGFVRVGDGIGSQGESLEDAAKRELNEETNINLTYSEQLYTFGQPDRDPRGRVITVAYFALVQKTDPICGSEASAVIWAGINRVQHMTLAFDHKDILDKALARLRMKIRYEPIGFNLLSPKFTLAELRHLYEGILNRKLDVSNFRKHVLATNVLTETGQMQKGQHRPAPYYRFNKRAYDHAVREGFHFEI